MLPGARFGSTSFYCGCARLAVGVFFKLQQEFFDEVTFGYIQKESNQLPASVQSKLLSQIGAEILWSQQLRECK
ncbi:MAG: hypothetical protein PHE47_09965 [Oscillospiraceae bacterium]|nr:hypothetical protein [Oscillospiraceae bacterium]